MTQTMDGNMATPSNFKANGAGAGTESMVSMMTTTRSGRPSRRRSSLGSSTNATANITRANGRRAYVHHDYHDHINDPIFQPDPAAHLEAVAEGSRPRRGPRGGVVVPFPEKLYNMLASAEKDGIEDIVSWQPHGRCFVVHHPKVFVNEVMPKYFNQSKLTSFQRQLNLYGFQRLTQGSDRGGYYHEYFLRGRPDLHRKLVRIRVKGTGFKAAASPATEPDFYKMRHCSEPSHKPEQSLRDKVVAVAASAFEEVLVDEEDTECPPLEENAVIVAAAKAVAASNVIPLLPMSNSNNAACGKSKSAFSGMTDLMSVSRPWLPTSQQNQISPFVSAAMQQAVAPPVKPLCAPSHLRDPFQNYPLPSVDHPTSASMSYTWGNNSNSHHPAYFCHTNPSFMLGTLERNFAQAASNHQEETREDLPTSERISQELPPFHTVPLTSSEMINLEPLLGSDGITEERQSLGGEPAKLQSWHTADWIGWDPLFLLDEEANPAPVAPVTPPVWDCMSV